MEKMNLHLLRNAEFTTFLARFLKIVHSDNPVLAAIVVSRHQGLARLLQLLEAALKADRSSDLSDDIIDLDAARDNQYSGLWHLAKAYSFRKEPEFSEAGKLVLKHMGLFGTVRAVNKATVDTQSALVKKFLSDIDSTPALGAALDAIGGRGWTLPLGQFNSEFETQWLARNAQRSTQDEPGSVNNYRYQAQEAYSQLCDTVQSFFITEEGAEPWARIVAESDQLTAEFRDKISARAATRQPRQPKA